MKKKLVTALAGLIAMISTSFGAAQFSDVPAGHWALEAVDVITKRGLIVGYPDGTFRGNENLTRYQAALIFYRLLTQEGGGQAGGMSDQDLMALRNAMQELAAELAALGVRVSALEDNAATKDDIARLEALIANAGSGMDQAALSDLADRVEAASVAADTALAQAQILADRLDALDGDLGALRSQVEADSDSIRALNELAVLLNQDVLSLQDRVTALEKSLGSGDLAAIEDVNSVREFATAMRADLVKLQDRVSALEANSFTISGWFRVKYSVYRAWSPTGTGTQQFDIDRVFGTTFSTGDTDLDGLVVDHTDLGSNSVPQGSASGNGQITLTFKPRTAVSDPGKLNSYKDWIGFSITLAVTDLNIETGAALANTFNVSNATTTFKIADGQALSFTFGRSVKLKFTEYLVDSDVNSLGHGFVANYNAGFAQLTGFYASILNGPWANTDSYARGLRAKFGLGAINLAASFAQWGPDQTVFNGTALDPFTLWGLDASAALGPLNLMAEYFNSSVNDAACLWFCGPLSYNGFYVKADGGFGPFTVGAHYRSISWWYTIPSWQLSMDGVGAPNNSAPYAPGYTGFGLDLKGALGPLNITARYDSFADYVGFGTNTYTAWSIAPSIALGAFTFSGFYDIADSSAGAANEASMVGRAPGQIYYTQWGIGLAVNGLVPNLSLNASYKQNWVDGSEGYLIFDSALWATYKASFGPLNVDNLVARYHNNLNAATGNNYTTTKFAVAVSTAPMAMPLAPSFSAVYATRNTVGNIATTSESKWSVGLKFNQFLFNNSAFEVKYGSYNGSNVSSVLVGNAESIFSATSDVLYDTNVNAAGVAGSVTGLYFTWTYWDLVFSYADFDLDDDLGDGGNKTHGQAFTISYKVTF